MIRYHLQLLRLLNTMAIFLNTNDIKVSCREKNGRRKYLVMQLGSSGGLVLDMPKGSRSLVS